MIMEVSLEAYRAAIGLFNYFRIRCFKFVYSMNRADTALIFLSIALCIVLRIALSNDVELNPGPFFQFGHLNARSLNRDDKFDEISELVKENGFDVFAVTETWLNDRVPNDCLQIPGYNPIIRLDRHQRMGGGVAFFTANSVVVKRRLDLELAAVEFLWIEFRIKHFDILCGVCYRPPDNDSVSLDNFFECFQLVLDKIRQLPKQYFIVMLGDFNAHYDVANPSGNSEVGGKLYSFLESNNLAQLITEPTRVTSNSSTILDLVITNCPERFSASGTLSPPSNCDHSVIFASMNLITHRSRSYKRQVWNFNNVNSADLNCELSQMDWFSLCDNTNDIDETYSCWYSHFRSIIEKYIPLKMVTIRPNDKPWMDSKVRHAIRRRDRLLRIHNIRPSPVTWESYRAQRNFVTSLIRFAKKSFYERANTDLSNPDTNCKKWWSIVNKVCGRENSSTIPPIIENEVPIFDSKEKACIFNDYFVLQTELPLANAVPPIIQPYQTQQFLSNIIATEEQVLELMKGVDISKACGYDGIGNKIIKLCSEGFHVYFTYFINLSLSLGQYPSAWKLANVIPLFKNDNPQHKVNYRPVSLLASFSKICERVVFFHLYNFLMETGFLYKFQSGFRPGDSTINQLIFLVHKIYEALEDGKEVRVVFLDISKAFDKVWHAGLLRKLEALGVQSPLLQWFESYLCNRKQRVVIEGQCSDWRTITSGVPQGSVLGPLLFLIYINDITDDLASLPLIYADDTTLLEIVDDPVVSAGRLNSDLHKISVWADKWLVTMNPVKSRNVIFSLKRNKQVHPPLFLSSNIVKDVESHTHLGLTLQSSMSWRKHIVQVFEKASKRLNMLKFVRFKVDRSILTSLYKSLIRPLMEYGDVIWNNCYDCDSALLDGVQYEAARLVTGAIKGTSSARLYKELAWESLSNRRKLHLLCQFYKIVKNLAPYYLSEMLPKLSSERTNYRLRSRENFTQFSCRTSRFQKSFFPSAITGWNSLDIDVRNSVSLPTFKAKLRSTLFPHSYNKLFDFSLSRRASIDHTRLRLGFSCLREYLFKINRCASPFCECGLESESVKHFFLFCPRYAAQRNVLFTSAATILGETWSSSGDARKINFLLYGVKSVNYDVNCVLFREVQRFIMSTNRFSMATV